MMFAVHGQTTAAVSDVDHRKSNVGTFHLITEPFKYLYNLNVTKLKFPQIATQIHRNVNNSKSLESATREKMFVEKKSKKKSLLNNKNKNYSRDKIVSKLNIT